MAIFTTVYSEFAVEGFNVSAVDYLLKPFTFERFLQAAEKAMELYTRQQERDQEYLHIRVDYSAININMADILFINGQDEYIKIHLHQLKPFLVIISTWSLMSISS